MELETENATLHLRVAKMMSQMKKANEKITFLNGRLSDAIKDKTTWKKLVYPLYSNFLVISNSSDITNSSCYHLYTNILRRVDNSFQSQIVVSTNLKYS